MKHLKIIFKLLQSSLLFLISFFGYQKVKTLKTILSISLIFTSSTLFAVSHSCNGTQASPVHGATDDASYNDTENSTGGGNYSGYYRFRPQVDGSVRIRVDNMHSNRQRIYIGTSCGDDSLHYVDTNSGMDETFDLTANEWYYIRIRERNGNNRIRYRLRLDFVAVDTGCDNSLDTSANDSYPGVAVPNLNGATGDASKCISGSSESDDEDHYWFKVNVAGTINIVTSSPNGHDNHFKVSSDIQGDLYATDTGQNRTLSYTISANETIYLRTKETGDDTDWWQIDLDFVAAANQAPTANPQSVTTNFNTPKDITLTGSDPENQSLSYVIVSGPSHGSLSGTAPNVTYTPTSGYSGSDIFSCIDNDGLLDSAEATVQIGVNGNQQPTANSQSVTTPVDTAKNIRT